MIENIQITNIEDYCYLETKVKEYHDAAVSALLRLSHRNPDKYNLAAFTLNYTNDYVWVSGTISLYVITHHILGLYLEGNEYMAKMEQTEHKAELAAFKRKIKKEGW